MKKIFTRTISTLLALTLAASFAVMPAWATEIEDETLTVVESNSAAELVESKVEEPAEESAPATLEETAVTAIELDEELIEVPVADRGVLLNNINIAIERYVVDKAQGSTAGITQADNRKSAKMVAEIAVAELSEEQVIEYTERFAHFTNNKVDTTSITGFIALYNEMVADSGIYDSIVETATDGSFNRMDPSRWMHADDGSAIYYTYSIQNGLAIPDVGVPYSSTGAVDLTDEQLRQVCRLLEAGYPLDMYGLSKYAEGFSAAVQAYFTQDVLFMLLGQAPIYTDGDPYLKALYDYAVGHEVLEPIDKVTITFDDKIKLEYSEDTNDYRATVALHVTGTADMVKIESIPEGTTLLYKGASPEVELKEGETIDPAGTLTMVTDGVAPITGSLRASFVSYHVVNTEIANFVSGKLILPIHKDGAAIHTPLMGYQIKAVPGETELSSISLVGPQNPEQFRLTVNYVTAQGETLADPYTAHVTKGETYDVTAEANKVIDGYSIDSIKGDVTGTMTGDVTVTVTYKAIPVAPVISTIDFAYATPEKENAAAAPEGVTVPARQSQENTSIRYSEPTPLHGSGEIPQGYAFHGWYSDEACTQKVASHTILASGTILYGYWTKEKATEPPTPPVGPSDPGVTTYKLTVDYVDHSGETLASSYTTRKNAGSRYDLTAQTEKAIEGYSIDRVEGEVAGTVRGNVSVTVYYAEDVVIPPEEPPLTDKPETDIPETDIPEEEPPLSGLPEEETPGTDQPGGDIEIEDPDVPLGDLPQTGSVDPAMTLGALALAASLMLAALAVTTRKRADGEQ